MGLFAFGDLPFFPALLIVILFLLLPVHHEVTCLYVCLSAGIKPFNVFIGGGNNMAFQALWANICLIIPAQILV